MKNKVYPLSPLPPPPPRRKAAEVVLDRAYGIAMDCLALGQPVSVYHRRERCDFPDIDQMLEDLRDFLPGTCFFRRHG